MNVKNFVSQSLKEIIDGVVEAQTYAMGNGARVSPHVTEYQVNSELCKEDHYKLNVRNIRFDIAVTVADSKNNQVDGGIKVCGFKGAGAHGSFEKNVNVNRLTFTVPIIFPDDNRKTIPTVLTPPPAPISKS